MSERDLDVVVFGATSVTGRRVAGYLQERAGEDGFSWAAAARDAGRAREVLASEGVSAPETLVADVGDPGSLAAMAERARVVLNLVGPYTLHGRPVIEACVAGGAHYADLTGEMPFVRRTIGAFDARAREAEVKVVQVCGFEALPPDLAVLLAAERAREDDEQLVEAELELRTLRVPLPPRPSDYVSGGTFQSLAAMTGDEDSAVIADPGALIDDRERAEAVRRRSPIGLAPRRGRGGSVVAPMTPSAFINPPVIHRTAALLAAEGDGPADPFAYREGVALDGPALSLPARYAAAGMLSGVQGVARTGARAAPGVRQRASGALRRILPSSGAGPAPERLEPWHWTMSLRARTSGGSEIAVEIDADGHPGYLATARMLGEAGLLMAEEGATPDRAGCITPALAVGTERIGRFDRAGLRFARPA